MRRAFRVLLPASTAALVACGGGVPLLGELDPEETCRRTGYIDASGTMHLSGSDDPTAAVGGAEAEAARTRAARDSTVTAATAGDSIAAALAEGTAADSASPRVTEVQWLLPEDRTQRQELNAWCAGVGPAIVARFAARTSPGTGVDDLADTSAAAVTSAVADSIAVVSWNVHVGGGSLEALVDDLRSGRLTGTDTVRHFVLLLQEAYREGELVPEPSGQPGGGLIEAHPVSGARRDIVADAEALGLSLFYAPSMRNGQRNSRGGFEDRGNAILSSMPLSDPFAIELPAVRQRRVATTAYVEGRTSAGESWRLQVTSVHLENDAEGWLNSERGRLIQTERLLDALPASEAAVVGGDFNTWTRGPAELVVRLMRDAFPDTPGFPPGPTYERAYGVVGMYLDYLFFQLPDGAEADYERLDRPYNSDHYPLLGWVALEP